MKIVKRNKLEKSVNNNMIFFPIEIEQDANLYEDLAGEAFVVELKSSCQ